MKEINDQELGAKIGQLRRERKMKQFELARVLGLHQATLSRIESGEQKITAIQLHALATLWGVSFNQFFRRKP